MNEKFSLRLVAAFLLFFGVATIAVGFYTHQYERLIGMLEGLTLGFSSSLFTLLKIGPPISTITTTGGEGSSKAVTETTTGPKPA